MEHARKHEKVVRFSSDEWAALKQQKWREPPQTPDPPMPAQPVPESLPSRAEEETLVQFVLRLLDTLDPANPISERENGSINQAELSTIDDQQNYRITAAVDDRQSLIETPTYLARLILSRLSESEIRKLEILSQTDLPALLKAFRNQFPLIASKHRSH